MTVLSLVLHLPHPQCYQIWLHDMNITHILNMYNMLARGTETFLLRHNEQFISSRHHFIVPVFSTAYNGSTYIFGLTKTSNMQIVYEYHSQILFSNDINSYGGDKLVKNRSPNWHRFINSLLKDDTGMTRYTNDIILTCYDPTVDYLPYYSTKHGVTFRAVMICNLRDTCLNQI